MRKKVKVPYYILQNASKKASVAPQDILKYLELISYAIDIPAKKALKQFYKEAKRV